MLFTLKKLMAAYIMPLPIVLLCLIVAFFCLRSNRNRLGYGLLVGATTLLLLSSVMPLFAPLFASSPLYQPYQGERDDIKYIAVLGSGNCDDSAEVALMQLCPVALTRLVEGIRIHRIHPESHMVFSGWRGNSFVAHAAVMARAAKSLGVAPRNITYLPAPRNTEAEARSIKKVVQTHPFILVTSLSHLERAEHIFNEYGMSPVLSPAQPSLNRPLPFLAPSSGGISLSEELWYEWMGTMWWFLSRLFESAPE